MSNNPVEQLATAIREEVRENGSTESAKISLILHGAAVISDSAKCPQSVALELSQMLVGSRFDAAEKALTDRGMPAGADFARAMINSRDNMSEWLRGEVTNMIARSKSKNTAQREQSRGITRK